MSRAMKAMTLAVVVLTVACLVLAYLWIDRSVSLAYSRQSAESTSSALHGLERVLEHEWRDLPEAEVLKRLQAAFPQEAAATSIVKKEGAVIWLDNVPFNFENGRLKSIGVQ